MEIFALFAENIHLFDGKKLKKYKIFSG